METCSSGKVISLRSQKSQILVLAELLINPVTLGKLLHLWCLSFLFCKNEEARPNGKSLIKHRDECETRIIPCLLIQKLEQVLWAKTSQWTKNKLGIDIKKKDAILKIQIFRSLLGGSAVMNPAHVHEDTGSIPGLDWWVKNLALPWAMVQVADTARIPCCCGCSVGWQQQLQLDP